MENMGIDLFEGFYKGKTILITGHTGFKGSWLATWLNELGANVIGYSLESYTKKDNYNASNLENKIISIIADIRNENKLNEVIDRYKPEIIFHLAAQPLVKVSYEDPKATYETNVIGTLNVLEAIRKNDSVKVGVIITTDKCYENKEQIWPYRENDPMGGYDPYSSSKACCEILISSYRNSFFNLDKFNDHKKAIVSARAGNVIGGGDWAKDRIIPDCIRALEENGSIKVRSPKAIRPWQHVLEPLYGYMLLARRVYDNPQKYSGGWNFGPSYNGTITVSSIVDLLLKYWGTGRWIDISSNDDVHEAKLLSLDCTKAKVYLQWESVLNIDETIRLTVEWYKNYHENMYEFNVNQIQQYCKLVKRKENIYES